MFKRYQSIENHYQQKCLDFWLSLYPELEKEVFIIEEKLDGANISIVLDENNNVTWCKRSGKAEDNFMGLDKVKDQYEDLIEHLKIFNESGDGLQLYGEIFGPGIQKRINYGDEIQIRFFDMRAKSGDNLFYLHPVGLRNMGFIPVVKTLGHAVGLRDALEFDTRIENEHGSLIEGAVIKPMVKHYFSPKGERFVLKKKNKEFLERPAKIVKLEINDEEFNKLRDAFLPYINDNRVMSVFSKQGEISSPKQIGDYLKSVMNDAKEDFEKDYGEVDRKLMSRVFKVANPRVVEILKEHL